LPAFGYTGSISGHNSAHGTTCSISSRNAARRVSLLYRSNPFIIASVLCFRVSDFFTCSAHFIRDRGNNGGLMQTFPKERLSM